MPGPRLGSGRRRQRATRAGRSPHDHPMPAGRPPSPVALEVVLGCLSLPCGDERFSAVALPQPTRAAARTKPIARGLRVTGVDAQRRGWCRITSVEVVSGPGTAERPVVLHLGAGPALGGEAGAPDANRARELDEVRRRTIECRVLAEQGEGLKSRLSVCPVVKTSGTADKPVVYRPVEVFHRQDVEASPR